MADYHPGARTLGLRSRTGLSADEAVRRGFSPDAPARLARALGLPVADVARRARIAPRTLARRAANAERLTPDESERVLRLASLYEQAVALLGSPEAARRWLNAPRPALGDQTPLALAETEVGAREAENLLHRLAHGVFS